MGMVDRNTVEGASGVGIFCGDYSMCEIEHNTVSGTGPDPTTDDAMRDGVRDPGALPRRRRARGQPGERQCPRSRRVRRRPDHAALRRVPTDERDPAAAARRPHGPPELPRPAVGRAARGVGRRAARRGRARASAATSCASSSTTARSTRSRSCPARSPARVPAAARARRGGDAGRRGRRRRRPSAGDDLDAVLITRHLEFSLPVPDAVRAPRRPRPARPAARRAGAELLVAPAPRAASSGATARSRTRSSAATRARSPPTSSTPRPASCTRPSRTASARTTSRSREENVVGELLDVEAELGVELERRPGRDGRRAASPVRGALDRADARGGLRRPTSATASTSGCTG